MKLSTIRILITTFTLQFISLNISAQERQYDFLLNGKISLDSGKINLELVADSSFYPKEMRHIQANVIKGRFFINGKLTNPLAYQISTENRAFISELFVLDTGKQDIIIDLMLNKSLPKINNKTMLVDYINYKKDFEEVKYHRKLLDHKWDSLIIVYHHNIPPDIQNSLDKELKDNYKENDSKLLSHVTKYPYSYYALWKLLSLTSFGYENIFKDIFANFSNSLQKSYTGNIFTNYLSDFNLISLNKKIQNFPLESKYGLQIDKINYATHDYTLLDFWYSHCSPCIAQFKDLKSIYNEYHNKGFEIIGISTDNLKRKNDWIKIIESNNLSWPQYLDLDGLEASKLHINAYPSNILVDSKGKVIALNLLPSELDSFLKSYFKKI